MTQITQMTYNIKGPFNNYYKIDTMDNNFISVKSVFLISKPLVYPYKKFLNVQNKFYKNSGNVLSSMLVKLDNNIYMIINKYIHVFSTLGNIILFYGADRKTQNNIMMDDNGNTYIFNLNNSIYDALYVIQLQNLEIDYIKNTFIEKILFKKCSSCTKCSLLIPVDECNQNNTNLYNNYSVILYLSIKQYIKKNNIIIDKFILKYVMKLYNYFTNNHNLIILCPEVDKLNCMMID